MARAEYLTDHELQTVQVPLPWFRDALRELRDELKGQTIMKITGAVLNDYVTISTNPDPEGVTYQWMGMDTYVKVGNTQLLLKYGEYFWFDPEGGVWLDTIYCRVPDPILRASQPGRIAVMTRSRYQETLRAARNKNCPANAQVMEISDGRPSALGGVLGQFGVRIQR
jgi:hypothetical protein